MEQEPVANVAAAEEVVGEVDVLRGEVAEPKSEKGTNAQLGGKIAVN